MNRITGRSAFLALLKDEGITHLFGNPGTTELPIMHALKEHPDLTYVLGLQESLVVAMADGFSRASGKLVACNVHVAPGLGNAMGSLFNAKFTGTPMILTAGQQEQGHGLTEPLLYDPLVPMAEPLVKWAVEVTRLEDLPRIVRRAAKVAMTPPTGPVFISLPGDILNAEAGIDLGASTRVDTRMRPSDARARQARQAAAAGRAPGHHRRRRDRQERCAGGGRRLRQDAGRARLPAERRLRRPLPLRARLLHGRRSRATRSRCGACSPSSTCWSCSGADPVRMSVWSEVEPLPDEHGGRAHRSGRLGHGQELRGRDGGARRSARDAAGPDAGARKAGRRTPGVAKAKARSPSSRRATGRPSARACVERIESARQAQAHRPRLAHPADRQRAAARRRARQRGPDRRPAT